MTTFAILLALCATAPAGPLPWVTLSDSGDTFVVQPDGAEFKPWGVNYDHDDGGRLLDEYWQKDWQTVVEDFHEIKALGANCVRIHLQLGMFMQSPTKVNPSAVLQLKKLLELAENTRLYLNITGLACYHKKNVPAWYDALPEAGRWEVQTQFWQAVAGACKDSPAVFCYDLMNEPALGGAGDKQWLVGKPLGGKYFVQRITLEPGDRQRKDIAAAWVNKLCTAIRSQDKRHLITVGVIPWAHVWPKAKPLFYTPTTLKHLDFVSVHFYPASGKIDKALAALKVYDLGRPVVVEETFPLKCSSAELLDFIKRSDKTADGWFSFYWGKKAEEYGEDSIAATLTANWLRAFQKASPVQAKP